ncbi:MAG: hypothetical protein PGN08_13415 [Sphingomonas taxi]
MIDLSNHERRRAFSVWLRTGRLPTVRTRQGVELKFNAYHDPQNGRFTFAPGGGRTGDARSDYAGMRTRISAARSDNDAQSNAGKSGSLRPRLAVASDPSTQVQLLPASQRPIVGRGANIRAFEDPMTLEQSFPGLRDAPGGALVAVADDLFDFSGPAHAMTMEILENEARRLDAQIREIDPSWHYDEVLPADASGNPVRTAQGLTLKINDLRFRRAAVIARHQHNYEPLQVETLRFIQERADYSYERGMVLLKAGRLPRRLSDQEALGSYVDKQVRFYLRARYNEFGIKSDNVGLVRVNRRENDSSGGERTYRRPDARLDNVAFDVTLTQKTLKTPQVRGFFNADFRPSRVVIIRPRQLGGNHTYAIPRPETNR